MASNVYKISTNEEAKDVSVASTSDPTETIECVIKTGTTNEQAILGLKKLIHYLTQLDAAP